MSDAYLTFSRLSFGYPSAVGLLFEELNCSFPCGWTGVVGFNGGGKSTLLKLTAGELSPDSGKVNRQGRAFLCNQECDDAPAELAGLIDCTDRRAVWLRETLGIRFDWLERWDTLSFGERKRAQIGCALLGDYDILCLDEPTNHLDSASAEQLKEALREFYGIGLLVSHDRALLDEFCDQCLFIEPEGVTLRTGNYTEGKALREIERENMRGILSQERAELHRMKAELQRRRQKAEKAENANSKRKLARHDHDGKGRIDAARVSGRSSAAANLVKQQRGKLERQSEKLGKLDSAGLESYKLEIPYGVRSRRNFLFALAPGRLEFGDGRGFDYPELEMRPDDRIGLIGPNGAGKSTLIRKIVEELKIDRDRLLYLPQEPAPHERENLMRKLDSLDSRQRGNVMRVIHNLGSAPERVLGSARLSPGELRKLHLALGINDSIELLIMDEPTNHLDLPSVECLESALSLAECGILLVSHDRRFLEKLCRAEWKIGEGRLEKRLM